jgi:hypothetical protein
LLTERVTDRAQIANLGIASRRLLSHSLDVPSEAALVSAAVGFVGDTYAADPDASRALLRRLFEPDRFAAHGDEDIPWLARKIEPIAIVDPNFAVEIFRDAFAEAITDRSEKPLGQSRILPLTSNRRQDYEHAQWTLAEFSKRFFALDPHHATLAVMRAIDGYVERAHAPSAHMRRFQFEIGGRQFRLIEDWSYIWASKPEGEQGDNAQTLLHALLSHLTSCPDEEARVLVRSSDCCG